VLIGQRENQREVTRGIRDAAMFEHAPRRVQFGNAARARFAVRTTVREWRRRIERERAYALNPDQPPVAPQSNDSTAPDSALAASAGHPKRRGFGHGRPVPALLMKRTASEPEKV
jgi:hypothetical protein